MVIVFETRSLMARAGAWARGEVRIAGKRARVRAGEVSFMLPSKAGGVPAAIALVSP